MINSPSGAGAPEARTGELSIGDLAERTGLSVSALRMWEQRYGFPVPQRLPGGHRRYTPYDALLVGRVLRRRDSGVRIEQAVQEVLTEAAPATPSVFATLRARHPRLPVHRLRKSTLTAMSWAIEDQVASLADRAVLWGSFQAAKYYRPSSQRWQDLARISGGVTVFADFPESAPHEVPRRVALPASAPMLREWAVVVDSEVLPVVLTAWEPPGQRDVPDPHRVFESVWSFDPAAVKDAAWVCAEVARDTDPAFADPAHAPRPILTDESTASADVGVLTDMVGRMAEYVDRFVAVDQISATPALSGGATDGS